MLWPGVLLSTGLSFLFLLVLFRPLEYVFPARQGQPFFRPKWLTDLLFFLGQYLLWGGLMLLGLTAVNQFVFQIVPESFRSAVASQPFWLQAIEVIFLSDFFVYWGHRFQHRIGFLW